MTDDEILDALRAKRTLLSPVQLAELLDRLTQGRLSQSVLVTYFKRAFPAIPLDVMLASGGWTGVGGREMTDEQFNEAIRPWLVP